jgi:hypothetical protein
MNRRNFVIATAAALAACSRQTEETEPPREDRAGRAITDPAAVIRQLYDPYLTQGATFPAFREQAPWSADLWALLETMMARSQALNEPILDFDPMIAAQDYQLTDLNVASEGVVENSHAVVRASFTNLNQATEVIYDMVWEDDRWKVNNIRGDGWDLRQIASAPNADAIAGSRG